MDDETNPDISMDKSSYISPLNEDNGHSPSIQHIEETQPRRVSSENVNNHSHIQSTQSGDDQHHSFENGDHIQHSPTLHSNQSTENQTVFIQETTPNDQQTTSHSHLQPLNTSDDHSTDSSQFSSEQEEDSIHDQDKSNLDENNHQSNFINNQDD